MKFNLTYQELKAAERSVYSQGGQDGVLEAIFDQLGEEGDEYFIEFGARDGIELSNTANLRLNHWWGGLLMDADPLSDIVHKETVTKDNINELLNKHDFTEADYISIDIDGNDYWVWDAIIQEPRVLSIEYNSKFKNDESYAIEYSPNHKWDGDDYYGASLLALKKLGIKKGYTLVYVVDRYDAVFVRDDLIAPEYTAPTLDELLPAPIIAHEKISNKRWVIV